MLRNDPSLASLVEIANQHADTEASLRLYFSKDNPYYISRFSTYLPSEVDADLDIMLREANMRSSLVLLARIEAIFRYDYKERSRRKNSDSLSIALRRLHKKKGNKAKLKDDIWSIWHQHSHKDICLVINQLRSVFKFRHWLAHGRHWHVGTTYDFQAIYLLADTIATKFPIHRS